MNSIGIVVIGRNEGERLRRCLQSALGLAEEIVYVDSGSSDGSVALARELGAAVVELDMTRPFTAARARNEGFHHLMQISRDVEFVQFVDGDCEIVAGWLGRAADELMAHPGVAVVCGRRRERFPEASIYNKLCDIEWDTTIGETKACGGDSMMRISALRQTGGFDATVIAGEEPELCFRLRHKGWKIFRLDADMTLHDADMTRFGQWWQRNVRGGHAYAQGSYIHGASAERFWVHQTISNWIWGLLLPIFVIASLSATGGISLLLLAMYPMLGSRVNAYARSRGLSRRDARAYAIFIVLGKIPQMIGQMKYTLSRVLGQAPRIIEYKRPIGPRPAHMI